MTFKDHFSSRAADYASHRPVYPQSLVDYLAGLCPKAEAAWDVGCGNGQLSRLLANRFRQVIATDASAQQIANAERRPNIEYRVVRAEESGLPSGFADLITVAQAAHWFDLQAFYKEVRRVGKKDTILALITYARLEAGEAIGSIVNHFYKDVIGPYWPAERRHVEAGYRTFPFPFEELTPPDFGIEVDWRIADLVGYIDTWSAVRNAEKVLGRAIIDQFESDLTRAWGETERRRIRFPLQMRIGRLD